VRAGYLQSTFWLGDGDGTGKDQGAGHAVHVLDDQAGMAGNVIGDMAAEGAGIGVVAAARR
jgi:hypothetical protein